MLTHVDNFKKSQHIHISSVYVDKSVNKTCFFMIYPQLDEHIAILLVDKYFYINVNNSANQLTIAIMHMITTYSHFYKSLQKS
jgi:hypothetical protein